LFTIGFDLFTNSLVPLLTGQTVYCGIPSHRIPLRSGYYLLLCGPTITDIWPKSNCVPCTEVALHYMVLGIHTVTRPLWSPLWKPRGNSENDTRRTRNDMEIYAIPFCDTVCDTVLRQQTTDTMWERAFNI